MNETYPELESIFVFSLTPLEAVVNLLVALLCGIFISMLYRGTYRGVSFSASNVMAIIMLAMITALVIMVIGNNLARAFGLVGAMSIIRFRTAVKDTQDIMFIFFALAVGLACGAGMYVIAATGTVTIGISIFAATKLFAENPKRREYLLQTYCTGDGPPTEAVTPLLDRYCTRHRLVNVKGIGSEDGELLEVSYYVLLRSGAMAEPLVKGLRGLENINRVNLFFDEE